MKRQVRVRLLKIGIFILLSLFPRRMSGPVLLAWLLELSSNFL
jgi:hypothetical protein